MTSGTTFQITTSKGERHIAGLDKDGFWVGEHSERTPFAQFTAEHGSPVFPLVTSG